MVYLISADSVPSVDPNLKTELERRVAWWRLAIMSYLVPANHSPMLDFYERYDAMINHIVDANHLDKQKINNRIEIIERLLA